MGEFAIATWGIATMRSDRVHPKSSVQLQSNSRGWLHRAVPRKRHQMRHLCDLPCLLAKQVLSQLSYTPTASTNSFNSKTLPTILLSDSQLIFLEHQEQPKGGSKLLSATEAMT